MFQHSFPFDPTYGHDQARLLQIQPPPEPADFAAFWQDTYAQVRATPLQIAQKPSRFANEKWNVTEVEFTGLGGFRCGAWLVVPRDGLLERGLVRSHGYGGRDAPEFSAYLSNNLATIFPCARGMNLSARADLPSASSGHVIHGIERRETYLHRGCVTDLWSALDVLLELFPDLEGKIDFDGGSFGGGIGAMALAWEKRFRRAHLCVPSFGHHPLRLTMPCVGSGESVRTLVATQPTIATDTLPYFDAAIAARHIATPTLVSPALFDPAVPPPGQFAVANAIRCEKKLHILPAGHFEFRGIADTHRELEAAIGRWLA